MYALPSDIFQFDSRFCHWLAVVLQASYLRYISLSFLIYKMGSIIILNSLSQFSLVAQSCLTLCDPMNHSTPGLLVHHQLLEFTQIPTSIESVMPSSHLILCRPLLLLPPIPPSIRVFSNESALRMRWPKY